MAQKRVTLVSVSGIDGAGKSTLINLLRAGLTSKGVQTDIFSFWDRGAAFPRVREFISHAVFRGDRGIGSATRPVSRQDKNIQTWYMTGARLCLYLLDTIHLRWMVARVKASPTEVAVFDRYIYDELANLPLNRWFIRAYVRMLVRVAPHPDIAYLVDADPVLARGRKPEYPLEFLYRNRASYLTLSQWVRGMIVIGPLPPPGTEQDEVAQKILRKLSFHYLRQFPPVAA